MILINILIFEIIGVVISDDDAAINAVLLQYPSIRHILCMYHLGILNLPKNLKSKLGSGYKTFCAMWWLARNATTVTAFDLMWEKVMSYVSISDISAESRESAVRYLSRLHDKRHQWALAWTITIFTARSHASGRVEKYQHLLKKDGTSRLSIVSHIQRMDDIESQHDSLQSFSEYNRRIKISSGVAARDTVSDAFQKILSVIKEYASVWYENETYAQMTESFLYTVVVVDDVGVLDESTQITAVTNSDEQGSFDTPCTSDDDRVAFMKTSLAELKGVSRLVSRTILESTLGTSNTKQQFHIKHSSIMSAPIQTVFILHSGGHTCTCMYLVNAGIICRHFWRVALLNRNMPLFNLDLVPRRWLKDEFQLNQPAGLFIAIDDVIHWSPEVNEDSSHILSLVDTALNTTRGAVIPAAEAKELSKKIEYADLMAVAKRAVVAAVDSGDIRKINASKEDLKQNLIKNAPPFAWRPPSK